MHCRENILTAGMAFYASKSVLKITAITIGGTKGQEQDKFKSRILTRII